ncbi:hypothetical protein AB835_12780 [Candidatus Endobugula sertula]|uniref:DUF637 domain-containing protein n=1 Tax=Candidatus Endobugula sertula TaxID=62101 RepID=A0A1D2QMA2_9GAMM|nr:hypothetical protein AB835_12780 [Candidatus Endobugula sertula]
MLLTLYCGVCGSGLWKGALIGAASAAANGGNILKSALTGAISGAAFAHIGGLKNIGDWTRTAYHALAGGVTSVIQGGKFGAGFLSAGFAKFATLRLTANGVFDMSKQDLGRVVGRTAVAAIVGGTASKLGGGKFANGAKTAAMAHLLNAELSTMNGKVITTPLTKAQRKALVKSINGEIRIVDDSLADLDATRTSEYAQTAFEGISSDPSMAQIQLISIRSTLEATKINLTVDQIGVNLMNVPSDVAKTIVKGKLNLVIWQKML